MSEGEDVISSPMVCIESNKVETPEKRRSILTLREAEAVALMAQGLNSKEIAARMSLSSRSVEGYLAHARTKMHAKTGPELVYLAVKAGIII